MLVITLAGLLLHALGFVRTRGSFACVLRASPSACRGWGRAGRSGWDRAGSPGQVPLRVSSPHVAEGEHVLQRRRDEIGRRLRGAGKALRVVLLIRMDHAARVGAFCHRVLLSVQTALTRLRTQSAHAAASAKCDRWRTVRPARTPRRRPARPGRSAAFTSKAFSQPAARDASASA